MAAQGAPLPFIVGKWPDSIKDVTTFDKIKDVTSFALPAKPLTLSGVVTIERTVSAPMRIFLSDWDAAAAAAVTIYTEEAEADAPLEFHDHHELGGCAYNYHYGPFNDWNDDAELIEDARAGQRQDRNQNAAMRAAATDFNGPVRTARPPDEFVHIMSSDGRFNTVRESAARRLGYVLKERGVTHCDIWEPQTEIRTSAVRRRQQDDRQGSSDARTAMDFAAMWAEGERREAARDAAKAAQTAAKAQAEKRAAQQRQSERLQRELEQIDETRRQIDETRRRKQSQLDALQRELCGREPARQ